VRTGSCDRFSCLATSGVGFFFGTLLYSNSSCTNYMRCKVFANFHMEVNTTCRVRRRVNHLPTRDVNFHKTGSRMGNTSHSITTTIPRPWPRLSSDPCRLSANCSPSDTRIPKGIGGIPSKSSMSTPSTRHQQRAPQDGWVVKGLQDGLHQRQSLCWTAIVTVKSNFSGQS